MSFLILLSKVIPETHVRNILSTYASHKALKHNKK